MNEQQRSSATPSNTSKAVSRRDLLKGSAATAATAALMTSGNYAFAQGTDKIRVGIIGCGGRGTDAGRNAVESSQGVEIVALADIFPDRVRDAQNNLKSLGDKYQVKDGNAFSGINAYQQLLGVKDVNYVILATPPGFRPAHFQAAVNAGKHIFTEKPVAVDPVGVRAFIAAGEIAKQKGLGVVAGTQRRHQFPYVETIKRIHDGAMGEVVGGQVYWNQGGLWFKPRQSNWNDFEWQLRNWLYFAWLSGDHVVEQHIHNLDVANWVMKAHPVKAVGLGGRQVRTDRAFGHIYDHFAVELEYPNGTKIQSMCRQQDGTASKVAEAFVGTKGRTNASGSIQGETRYRYEGANPNPYVQEHTDNIAAIRAGKPLNEARQVAESTLTAIMCREACYTGQEIAWDELMNSKQDIIPPQVKMMGQKPKTVAATNVSVGVQKIDTLLAEWDAAHSTGSLPVPPVAMPGKTKLERGAFE